MLTIQNISWEFSSYSIYYNHDDSAQLITSAPSSKNIERNLQQFNFVTKFSETMVTSVATMGNMATHMSRVVSGVGSMVMSCGAMVVAMCCRAVIVMVVVMMTVGFVMINITDRNSIGNTMATRQSTNMTMTTSVIIKVVLASLTATSMCTQGCGCQHHCSVKQHHDQCYSEDRQHLVIWTCLAQWICTTWKWWRLWWWWCLTCEVRLVCKALIRTCCVQLSGWGFTWRLRSTVGVWLIWG